MKEKIKNNYKILVAFILGGIIIGGLGTAYAVSIASSSVSYDNTTSGATATDVKGAIDELYSLAGSCLKRKPLGDDSWETIINNARSGLSGLYTVGSTKDVDMGTFGTHTLRVANTSTPTECGAEGFSQTACGFVLEFADIITTHSMNPSYDNGTIGTGNVGGWASSEMRTYVNTDIYNSLPTLLKNAIINTTVVSGHGNKDTTNFTTTDKLYLLSTHEVWEDNDGNTSSGIDLYDTGYNNTRQLDYYKNNNVTTSSYASAKKQNNGSNDVWWLRSAYSSYNNSFWRVYSSGYWYTNYSYYTYGVAPAFRIA